MKEAQIQVNFRMTKCLKEKLKTGKGVRYFNAKNYFAEL